jgi:hypothetical protein
MASTDIPKRLAVDREPSTHKPTVYRHCRTVVLFLVTDVEELPPTAAAAARTSGGPPPSRTTTTATSTGGSAGIGALIRSKRRRTSDDDNDSASEAAGSLLVMGLADPEMQLATGGDEDAGNNAASGVSRAGDGEEGA